MKPWCTWTGLPALALTCACLSFPTPSGQEDGGSDAPIMTTDARVNDAIDAGCVDGDGDGYLPAGCASALPPDCDDTDRDRHPGAFNACDSTTDADCSDVVVTCGEHAAPNSVADNSGFQVTNGQIIAHFDSAEAYVLASLQLRPPNVTQNLLHTDLTSMREMFTGVHIWDQYFVHDPDPTPIATVLARGNAVFRMRVQGASGMGQGLAFDTYHTVFPDGRIHRDEAIEVQMEQTGRQLTSYVAVDSARFTHAHCNYAPASDPLLNQSTALQTHCSGQSTELRDYACVYHDTTNTMLGFIHDIPTSPTFNGARVAESEMAGAASHSAALIFDWFQNEDFGPGSFSGNFVTYAGTADAAPNQCQQLGRLRDWLFNPAQIDPDGTAVLHTGGASDDDNDGYYEGGGFWAIVAGDPNELQWAVNRLGGTRAIPERAAFRLHNLALDAGSGRTYDPVVYVDGVPQINGRDYLWQVDDDPFNKGQKVGWLYFAKPLANAADTTTIQVRVPNGSR